MNKKWQLSWISHVAMDTRCLLANVLSVANVMCIMILILPSLAILDII